MVVDSIYNCDKYTMLHKNFKRVFSFLKELKEDVAVGNTILEKDNLWANVIEVSEISEENHVFEAHRQFIDIHYIVCGEVQFGYANINNLKTKEPYNTQDDYEMFEGDVNVINLKKGDFMITYPEDGHIPDFCKTNENKHIRVVVKVRI